MLRKRDTNIVAVRTSAGLQILDGDRRFILRDADSANAASKLFEALSRAASQVEMETVLAHEGIGVLAAELLAACVLEESGGPVSATVVEDTGISVSLFPFQARTLAIARYGQFQLKRFRVFAKTCYDEGTVLLPAYCSGAEAILGPLVFPGMGACWNCARLRAIAAGATPIESWALDVALLDQEIGTGFTGNRQISDWMDEEARRIARGDPDAMQAGQVRIRNLATNRITVHDVLPVPGCTLCGGPASSHATGREAESIIDERFGIVRRVLYGTADGETPMLPICARAIASAHIEDGRGPLPLDDAFGKGLTMSGAFQSAVGEAIERYSACWVDPRRLHRATCAELGDEAFHPAWLTLYQEEQYRRPGFPYARYDPNQPIDWVRGQFRSREVWVPAIAVFQRYACAANEAICQITSNGLAAGTSIADASRRALLELIERDAVLFSWYTRTPGRRLKVSCADDPEIIQMIRDVEALGGSVELYWIDSGMPAHTVVCLGIGDGVSWPGCTVGYGADTDIRAATRKAVLEHGQIGPYFRRIMRENRDPIPSRPEDVRTLQDHELFYLPASRAAAFDFFRFGREGATPLAEVPKPARSFEDLDVAFVDVTSPDLAGTHYRVVRAVCKNFLPVYSGYGFERLNNPRLSGVALNRDIPPIC